MSAAPADLRELAEKSEAGLAEETRAAVQQIAAEEGVNPQLLSTLDHHPKRLQLYLEFYEPLVTEALGGSSRLKDVIRERAVYLTDLRERRPAGARRAGPACTAKTAGWPGRE